MHRIDQERELLQRPGLRHQWQLDGQRWAVYVEEGLLEHGSS